MNIEEFRAIVSNYITEHNEGVIVSNYEATKNNGIILFGITINYGGDTVLPTIYLESFFEEYKKGKSIDEIAERIVLLDKENRFAYDMDFSFFSDYEKVKEKLYVKMINKKENAKLLEVVPYRTFLDLAMVVYCDVSDICKMEASVLIRNEHIKHFGVSEEEMIDSAYENTRSLGAEIKDLYNIVENNLIENDNHITTFVDRGKMFVMTNNRTVLGAVCMSYDDKLDEFISGRCDGVFIIPSSIHEVILIPNHMITGDTGIDVRKKEGEGIKQIIESVNRNELAIEDVLSYNVYYYSSYEGYSIV